eukprot:Phypoly_transcript_07551.p1 GENE.Phypoly_transcript_07551~~Phypoly_transcript_07551.p1  ORF type:complete len:506 (+),score=84.93 Phypoly_transcript_07551:88-1605(+)
MAYVFLSEGQQRQAFQAQTTTPSHVGPGYYETSRKPKYKRSSSAPFLSKQARDLRPVTDTRITTPGPGTYETDPKDATHPKISGESRPSSSFASHTHRFDDDARHVPGPGSYTPVNPTPAHHPPQKQATAADSVAFQKHLTPPSVPTSNYGYDVDYEGNLRAHKPSQPTNEIVFTPKRASKGPDFTKAAARRSVFEEAQANSVVPGPGDYNPAAKTHNGPAAFSASRAPRFQTQQTNYVPGPTDYDPNLQIGKKPVVQKYQHPTLKFYDDELPPPKPTVIRGSTVKKKSSSRPRSVSLPPSPGPGDYILEASRQERKAKAISFQHSARFKEDQGTKASTPGPGAYELPASPNKGPPRFSHTTDRFARTSPIVPGPGDYDIDKDALSYVSAHASPVFASTTGRAVLAKDEPLPAPMYNVHKDLDTKKSISFSHAPRFEASHDTQLFTPGPGSYNASLAPHPRPPRSPSPFGFTGKRFQEEGENIPGPGDYDSSQAFQKKSFNKYLQ